MNDTCFIPRVLRFSQSRNPWFWSVAICISGQVVPDVWKEGVQGRIVIRWSVLAER